MLGGTIHISDAAAGAAQGSVTAAYTSLASQACTLDYSGTDLGTLVLTPGVYCFSSSAQLTGTLTLNAGGNANAVFIFKIGSTLTTASGSNVVLINGGSLCNVFWQVGSSATLGTTTTFIGNILALTSITLNTGARITTGRALARNGAVTLDNNAINVSACSAGSLPPTPAPTPGPLPTVDCATNAELFIVKEHTDVFVVGANANYTIALFNHSVASSGPITVTDTLPAGLTFVSATGVGWTCAAAGQVVTCTTNASAPARGPNPNNITVTVVPTAAAVPVVTNTARVSGGGDCDVTNNTTADVTPVSLTLPVPTLSEWAFIMLAVLLAAAGVVALRRRTS